MFQRASWGNLTENFCHAKQILAIKGVGVGGLRESVKKENRDENLFQITLNEVLKCCKKLSTDIKTDVKREIKELAQ